MCVVGLSVGFFINQPQYLRNCKLNEVFEPVCLLYNYNERDCFPWDKRACQNTKKEYDMMCPVFDCEVRSEVILFKL